MTSLCKSAFCVLITCIFLFNTTTEDQATYVQELYYPQPLDHFGSGNMSTIMFNQRYFIDRTHSAGPKSKSPLLVYFGGEGPVDIVVNNLGVMNEAAPRFGATVLYIEHRGYGNSIPFGSIDIAIGDEEVRGCLTSEQALMDSAELILFVKKNFLDRNVPIIVMGCSYSGMLAAWFRLKFPHIAIGALASSAPVFYFDTDAPESGYCEVVSHDFKVVSEKCYNRITASGEIIINISLRPNGLDYLSNLFNTCSPLLTVNELTSSLFDLYSMAAQYNGRFNTLINGICENIIHAPDNDILGGISRAVLELNGGSCFKLSFSPDSIPVQVIDQMSLKTWDWQLCNEFIIRQGCGNGTMFQPRPYNLTNAISYCMRRYGRRPRLNWISTYYGGYANMKSALKNFASNIIFSNGLMDPLSPFGVLEDISKEVVAITTKQGSHCLDFDGAKSDDPKWLTHQREKEIKILARWIQQSELHKSAISKAISPTFFFWITIILVAALINQ